MKNIFSSSLALTLLALGGCSSTGAISSDTGKAGEIKQAITYQPYFLKNQGLYCRVTTASGTAGYPTSRAGLIMCDQSTATGNPLVHSFLRIPSGSNVIFQVATGPDSVGKYVARNASPSRLYGNMYSGLPFMETACGNGSFTYQDTTTGGHMMAYDSTGIRTSSTSTSSCTTATANQWTWVANGAAIAQPTASDTSTNTHAPATYFPTLLSRAWKITMPVDLFSAPTPAPTDIYENEMANWYHLDYFFGDSSPKMVFKVPNEGLTTSGSENTRSELREMLRNGDATLTDMAAPGNSWSLATNLTGATCARIGGKLSATLHVDHVADSGCNTAHYGSFSVIVGQIHANDLPNPTNGGFGNEPLKISYKKHPGHAKGSVYWSYQNNWPKGDLNRTTAYQAVWGKIPSDNTDPGSAGVALGEDFSYVVNVAGNVMTLTFTRAGAPTMTFTQDLSVPNNGTDNPQGWKYDTFYFKAGAYNQSNTLDDGTTNAAACDGGGLTTAQQYSAGDYAQVTFSALTVGASGTTAATCTDGIKNQSESDLDCGGSGCPTCAFGKICTGSTSCRSNSCISGLCASVCGDNTKEGTEGCDDGNTVTEACTYGLTSCTVCSSTCTSINGATSRCGDAILQSANGEQCDDGNTVATDTCNNSCIKSTCSDGVKNQNETDIDCGNLSGNFICNKCSPGKTCTSTANCLSPNTCTSGKCTAPAGTAVCGNGVVEIGETCDDGNTIVDNCTYGATSCTTCNTTCTGNVAGKVIKCGDSVVQTANGEQCDDGNTVATDTCNNSCIKATCSDTVKNQGESDVDCGNTAGNTICSKCATGKICTTGTNCSSGVCTSGLCAASAGGTTYQAGSSNMTYNMCGANDSTWWWMEDSQPNVYMQWSNVVAGSSVTVRFSNDGSSPGSRLQLLINGVSKEIRTAPVSSTGVDVVFNYAVAAGQSVKVVNYDQAMGYMIDYIKVQ